MEQDIFERAKREINLKEYILETYGGKSKGANGKWCINPNPLDGKSKDNFFVSYLPTGQWLFNAFNSDEGGSIIDLLEQKENLNGQSLMNKLNGLLGNKMFLKKPRINKEKDVPIDKLQKFINLIDNSRIEYFLQRNISNEVIEKYKLGTSADGLLSLYSLLNKKTHPKMRDHKYIIPCFDEFGLLRNMVARNYKKKLNDEDKKTWNVSGLQVYFLNEFYLQGVNVNEGDVILITESWGDAFAAESVIPNLKVVALHSTSGVKKLDRLLTANIKKFKNVKFIIAFNNDYSIGDGTLGPGQKATKEAIQIMKALGLQYETFIPEDYNDLNEWLVNAPIEFEHALTEVIDKLKEVNIINFSDNSLEAFNSWISGNLRALINSRDENKFAWWNGKAWVKQTEEESRLIYGDFISACRKQFNAAAEQGKYISSELGQVKKIINAWDTTNRTNEGLNAIKRSRSSVINIKNYDRQFHIHCSSDGKIIDTITGDIREAKKEDMILDSSPYKLVPREEAIKFMEDNILKLYRYTLDSDERLNFELDFIALKMQGRNQQLAVFNIGAPSSGKSFMKNIMTQLFPVDISHVPYGYYTTAHKGNAGVERDDILVSLNDKLLALSSEPDFDSDPISVGRFKNILSNATTNARATGGTMCKGIDLSRLDIFIDCNNRPRFTHYDGAISNRLLFVNWINSVPLEKRDTNFFKNVIKPNFDYVWSYFIYRAIDLGTKKLFIPEIIKNDSLENKSELDSMTNFIINKLEVCPGAFVAIDEVISELLIMEKYPELIDEKKKRENLLARIQSIKGFEEVYRKRKDVKGDKVQALMGIRYKEDQEHGPFN